MSRIVRIKALTVWQPWASLAARGAAGNKRYLQRAVPCRYRGPIAIHAGLMRCAYMGRDLEWLKAVAQGLGIGPEPGTNGTYEGVLKYFDGLPYGAIVGVGMLSDCWEILDETWRHIPTAEKILGNWQPGGYALELRDVQTIDPIPHPGIKGLWEWDAPADIVDRLDAPPTVEAAS